MGGVNGNNSKSSSNFEESWKNPREIETCIKIEVSRVT